MRSERSCSFFSSTSKSAKTLPTSSCRGASAPHVVVLLKVSDVDASGPGDRAEVGFEFLGHQAKERGLARAVDPDESDGFTGVDLGRRVAQHDLRSELLGHALDVDRRHAPIVADETGSEPIRERNERRKIRTGDRSGSEPRRDERAR